MKPSELVVFDCNVYFQAFISETGPAAKLLEAVNQRKILLFLSEFVLDELRDVLARPNIVSTFQFTDGRMRRDIRGGNHHGRIRVAVHGMA